MRRRVKRAVMWAAAAAALVFAALLCKSVAAPAWWAKNGVAAGLNRGHIEAAWVSGTIFRQQDAWGVLYPEGFASVLAARSAWWRPRLAREVLAPASPARPAVTLTTLSTPIWPWIVASGLVAGLLWRRTRSSFGPGRCKACGYDLAGLKGGRCPECGGALSFATRWAGRFAGAYAQN